MIMELTAEMLFKVAGDPAIYRAAPYLEPMKSAALNQAANFRGGCVSCKRAAYVKVTTAVAAAATRLLKEQFEKDATCSGVIRQTIEAILGVKDVDQFLIRYREGNQTRQLVF